MREGDHVKGRGLDGRVILRMRSSGTGWLQDWIYLAQDKDTCKRVNELPASIKCREFLK